MENNVRYDLFAKGIFIDPTTSSDVMQKLIARIRPAKSSLE